MRRRLIASIAVLALAGSISGCTAASDASSSSASGGGTSSTTNAANVDTTLTADAVVAANSDPTTVNDDEWSADDAADITLSGVSATTEADGVTVEDGTVTITAAGVYRLTGSLTGGVVVAAGEDDRVVLILDGATITNDAGPAISVTSADDAAIYLAEGSTNSVSDASGYADDADANAAIWSDADLTLGGTGSLSVAGNGNDGITSKDDLVVLSGAITVTAADDALVGKDALVIEGGTLKLTAGGDALKSDKDDDETKGWVWVKGGTIDATAGDDGISAATDVVFEDGTITITAGGGADQASDENTAKGLNSGIVTIVAGGTIAVDAADDAIGSDGSIGITGGELSLAAGDDGVHADLTAQISDGTVTVTRSVEGLEGNDILVSGGTVDITSSDDGINGSGDAGTTDTSTDTTQQGMGGGMDQDTGETVEIAGGTVTVNADGDGIDSNGSLTFSGGTITVYGPTNSGNGTFDANGTFLVTGGTIIGVGSTGMAQTPDDSSTQNWVATTADIAAGQQVDVVDSDGTTVASVTSPKQAGMVFYSSADVADGGTYTVKVAGTESGTVTEGESNVGGGMGMGGGNGGGQPGGDGGGQRGGGQGGQQPGAAPSTDS